MTGDLGLLDHSGRAETQDPGGPPPAVLLVGNFLSRLTGNYNVCEDLAHRLVDAGWPVLTTSERKRGLARSLDMVATAWLRRRDYEVAQVDVFSGRAFVWAEAVAAVLRRARRRFALTLHGGGLPDFSSTRPERVRRLLASAEIVTAPSRYLADTMSPYHPDIKLLPNPLDLPRYKFRIRRRVEPRMVWVRAFHGMYAPSLVPQILDRLRTHSPLAAVTMVGHDKGDGSLQRTEQTARALDVASGLRIVGGVPKVEVPHWLDDADIFLNTTTVDNTPVSVLEAMASGLCIVSTDVGGLPYLLDHERTALLVPPGDPDASPKRSVGSWWIQSWLRGSRVTPGRRPKGVTGAGCSRTGKRSSGRWHVGARTGILQVVTGRAEVSGLPLRLYHGLPSVARSAVASARGMQLRSLRYDNRTEERVEAAIARERWSAAQLKNYREERLAQLLHRAATAVPVYRDMWAARRRSGDCRSWEYLDNWPILDKETLRARPLAFLATDSTRRRMIRESTSGTTGTPIRLWFSRAAVREWYALFEARWRGWEGVSRHDRWGMLGGQLVVRQAQRRPPFWVWNAGLNQLYMSVYHLAPDLAPHYLDAIGRYRLRYLLGYTSALHNLAQKALRQAWEPPPLAVVLTNGEPLYHHQREEIAEAFRCPVRETYGLSETVASASECDEGRLHLWPEVGLLEVAADESGPAALEGDLLAAGFVNPDMPLIRYRLGDRGSLSSGFESCECGRTLPVLGSIEGRSDDVLFTRDGRRVGRLDPVFKGDPPIHEAQIVQESRTRVRVRYTPAVGREAVLPASIAEGLRQRLGDVDVIMDRVNSIPRTANGKFRAVVCEIPPDERPG